MEPLFSNATISADFEDYLVTEKELQQHFVPPRDYPKSLTLLERHRHLWLVGPPGVGKRTIALALANDLKKQNEQCRVYHVPRSVPWTQVARRLQHTDGNGRYGLDPDLHQPIVAILARQTFFTSNDALRALFVDNHMPGEWQINLPEADTIGDRINKAIAFLYQRENEYGNGLLLFLRAISEQIDQGLDASQELTNLTADLESRILLRQGQETVRGQNVFIFADALGSTRLEREELDSDLRSLGRLAQEHFLIFTSAPTVFDEADQTHQLRSRVTAIDVTPDLYDEAQKMSIFEICLRQALDNTKVSRRQYDWAVNRLLRPGTHLVRQGHKDFPAYLAGWLPSDIYRFVFVSLPTVQSANQIYDLLEQNADLNSQLKTWFVGLDPSTRAFVFTLVLFGSQPERTIWEMHKKIIAQFKKLHPELALFPLGIFRQLSAPYVTESGPLDFINLQVYEALVQEVACNYREYFLDQLDLFITMSFEDSGGGNQTADGAIVRPEFTLLIGEVAKQNPYDVEAVFKAWAGKNQLTSVANTLEYTTTHNNSLLTVFDMLDRWLEQRGTDEVSKNLRRAVGYVLWRIVSAQSPERFINLALRLVAKTATDPEPRVVSSAAYALLKMSPYVSLRRVRGILTNLAKRKNIEYKYIAWIITQSDDTTEAIALLENWLQLENPQRHEVAYFSLLTGNRLPRAERLRLLQDSIRHETKRSAFTSILFASLKDRKEREKGNTTEIREIFTQAVDALDTRSDWGIAADILDDLQKREQASNRDRVNQEPDGICGDLLQEWLKTDRRTVCWVATYSLWIGEYIDLDDGVKWLTQMAHQQPDIFVETVIQAIRSGSHTFRIRILIQRLLENREENAYILSLLDRSEEGVVALSVLQLTDNKAQDDSLLHFLNTHPIQFLEAVAFGLESENPDKVWENLASLADTEDFVFHFSAALQQGYKENVATAWQVTDALLDEEDEDWLWTAIHALLGSHEASPTERYPRLQQVMEDEPILLIDIMEWYGENTPPLPAFQTVSTTLCESDSPYRQQFIEAVVITRRREKIDRNRLHKLCHQIKGIDSHKLVVDIMRRLFWAELSQDGNFSLTRFSEALFDITVDLIMIKS